MDIKLSYRDEEYFDINFSGGDVEKTYSYEPNVIISVFSNKRANNSEISVIENQGGWWGNVFTDIEYGSKLWITYQSPTSQLTKNKIKSYIQESVQWLIDNNIASDIEVDVSSNSNISIYEIKISIIKNNILINSYLFNV